MSSQENKGFDSATIKSYRDKIQSSGNNFILDADDEQSEEYAHFYFIGAYEGKEVVYDAAMYTLRLHHESEVYEIAEARAIEQFPKYKKIMADAEAGTLDENDPLQEEIGMYLAEVILELEDEETVKVTEHVEQDIAAEFGISLDIGLNVDRITSAVISKFVNDFNGDRLQLDETLYSFQSGEDDEG